MALDFQDKATHKHLFVLDDKQLCGLEVIFNEFTYCTGQTIDPYGDFTMDKQAQLTILKIIDQYIERSDLNKDKAKTVVILGFRELIRYFMDKNIVFELFGD